MTENTSGFRVDFGTHTGVKVDAGPHKVNVQGRYSATTGTEQFRVSYGFGTGFITPTGRFTLDLERFPIIQVHSR